MSGNTIGRLFAVTSFGESHGPALGCIVDGCPPGLELTEAELETIEIPPAAAMAGRPLREIPLRTQTGASIVAIERSGQRLINPGPEEVLQPGDRVLLIGQAEQLPGARDLLLAAAAGPAGNEASA